MGGGEGTPRPHPRCPVPSFLPSRWPAGQHACIGLNTSPCPSSLPGRELGWMSRSWGKKREHKERSLLLTLSQAGVPQGMQCHPVPFQEGPLTQTHFLPPLQPLLPVELVVLGQGPSTPSGQSGQNGVSGDPRLSRETCTHIHTHTHTHALILNKIPFAHNLKLNTQLIPAEGSRWRGEQGDRKVRGTRGLGGRPGMSPAPGSPGLPVPPVSSSFPSPGSASARASPLPVPPPIRIYMYF